MRCLVLFMLAVFVSYVLNPVAHALESSQMRGVTPSADLLVRGPDGQRLRLDTALPMTASVAQRRLRCARLSLDLRGWFGPVHKVPAHMLLGLADRGGCKPLAGLADRPLHSPGETANLLGGEGPVNGGPINVFAVSHVSAASLQRDAEHVERGCWRDNALPKFFDAPGSRVSAMGRQVGPAPSELLECRSEAGAVVHDLPAIREDDRDTVGRLGVVAGDAHGSGFRVDDLGDDSDPAPGFHRVGKALVKSGGKNAWLLGAGNRAGDGILAFELWAVGDGVGLHSIWWFGVGSRVVQLRTDYTFLVCPQELFTLFLCSPKTAGLRTQHWYPAMTPTPSQPDLAPNSPVGVIGSDPLFISSSQRGGGSEQGKAIAARREAAGNRRATHRPSAVDSQGRRQYGRRNTRKAMQRRSLGNPSRKK